MTYYGNAFSIWIYKIISVFLFPTLLTSCSNRLDEVLNHAGENKSTFVDVLKSFESDSDKYASALFLIENMPDHGSPGKSDLKEIDYQTLSDNINLAVDVWRKRPWAKHYSFEDLCEYILPYRIADEPLENWRRIYYNRYASVLDSLYRGDDPVEAAKSIAAYLKSEGYEYTKDLSCSHLGALTLLEHRRGACREFCDIGVYVMRALGIPVVEDRYLYSPVYNSKHLWTAVIDTTGLALTFVYTDSPISRTHRKMERRRGKVYRYTYGYKKENLDGLFKDEAVLPVFRNQHLTDVTKQYPPCNEIKFECPTICDKWVYLSTFDGDNYIPLAITKINEGTITFPDVENNMFYFPTVLIDGKQKPIYYPVMVNNLGKTIVFNPSNQTQCIECKRKYPMRLNRWVFFANAIGSKIYGNKIKNLTHGNVIVEFNDTLPSHYNVIPVNQQYKSIRYVPADTMKIEISEIHFYADGNEITPDSIFSSNSTDPLTEKMIGKLSDGDWSSFYNSKNKGEDIVFEFDSSQHIDYITFMPRNDDNFIRPGDLYELMIHDGANGWLSIEQKISDGITIKFYSVPRNAVYLLKNHSRGKEIRPFYFNDSTQIFN